MMLWAFISVKGQMRQCVAHVCCANAAPGACSGPTPREVASLLACAPHAEHGLNAYLAGPARSFTAESQGHAVSDENTII
jgi:hypothetical protein